MVIVAILWALWALPLLLALVAGGIVLNLREEALSVSSQHPTPTKEVETTDPTFGWARWGFQLPVPAVVPANITVTKEGAVFIDGPLCNVDWATFRAALVATCPPRMITQPQWVSAAAETAPARPASLPPGPPAWRLDRQTEEFVSLPGRRPGRALAHYEEAKTKA